MDHKVKGGETLSVIALRELGDALRWREIYDLNKTEMDAAFERAKPTLRRTGAASITHPSDYLTAGQVLRLP